MLHITSGYTISKNADPEITLSQYLIPDADVLRFSLQHIAHSPHLTYYTFQETWNTIPIENAIIKIAVDADGNIQFITGQYYRSIQCEIMAIAPLSLSEGESIARNANMQGDISMAQIIRADALGHGKILNQVHVQSYLTGNFITLLLDGDQLLETDDHRSYFDGPDSLVQTMVFLPDPLTTAGVTYGGDFTDNNDSDIAALNDQRVFVSMRVAFENDTFFLRNDSVVISDLNVPVVPVAFSLTPEFIFTRSEEGFEDANTFYHITHFNDYINNLGYSGLQNFPIRIDPHGANGDDQSFYAGGAFPTIQYGEGGVDDAEDADVLLHEYGHALSDHASPGSNSGIERRAIDEGYGDYFAVSYSRAYSDFNWQNVFSWDGHNEFWFGRNANTNKHYPEDNSDNIYAACEIWSGALMDIFDAIGKENTDKMVLEALYGSTPDMTMPEAAQLILAAEETIFGGTFHETVYDLLDARGLIHPLTVSDPVIENSIQIFNSKDYAFANASLVISLPESDSYSVALFSVDGKLIFTQSGAGKDIVFDFHPASAGIYFLHIETSTAKTSFAVLQN